MKQMMLFLIFAGALVVFHNSCKKLHLFSEEQKAMSSPIIQEQVPGSSIGDTGWIKVISGGDTVQYHTVRAADQQVWLQQNLGSVQVAMSMDDTSSYGGLYQWGRWSDGHEVRMPPNLYNGMPYANPAELPVSVTNPYYYNTAPNTWWANGIPSDRWHAPDTAGVSSTNGCDPCRLLGSGWRLPYNPEWRRLITTESITDAASAFASNLKLPAAGHRNGVNGLLYRVGTRGFYWSSTPYSYDDDALVSLFFETSVNAAASNIRGNGYSIRCIKGYDGDVTATLPGTVIAHVPTYKRYYVGSPSIAILPNGDYIASNDFFGPNNEARPSGQTMTRLYKSTDDGVSWTHLVDIDGQTYSNLFVHAGILYLMGVDGGSTRNVIIRKSTDNGVNWTVPTTDTTGIIRATGIRHHTAPTPVVEHDGRLWRAMEDEGGTVPVWPKDLRAFMLSAPIGSDLLKASNWTETNKLPFDSTYLAGNFHGWLEGNAVPGPSGEMLNVIRVNTWNQFKDRSARIAIDSAGTTASFNPSTGFSDMPGGGKKFSIRYDSLSGKYWTLVNYVPPAFQGIIRLNQVRNTLALCSSTDLQNWTVNSIVIEHPDIYLHGFQYVDWQFDGADIIAVSRTSHDDGLGGANSYHDANYLTFHRIEDFRILTDVGP